MMTTFKEVKKLGEKLTGLKIIKNDNVVGGCFTVWDNLSTNGFRAIIEIETKPFFNKEIKQRGFNKKYFLLQILLHEIAHYKQHLKFKNEGRYKYNFTPSNYEKLQKLADRYALIYYRRFVK